MLSALAARACCARCLLATDFNEAPGDTEGVTPAPSRMDDWLSDQREAFEALVGCSIDAWRGVEIALRENTPTGPRFEDPEIACLQLRRLDATVRLDEHRTIDTYQDGDEWGLRITETRTPAGQCDGIYRERVLDLPLGIVDAAEVRFDEGTLAEVTLTIVGAPLLFVAAEFYENNDGTLHLNRCDESVLVFTNLADAAALTWIPARHV